ncbi:MAG: NFACT family protein [Bacilli bacterium]|nr:NFACT family protein [Bacilli bacterium]
MSFDGNILHKITDELHSVLLTGRINKIYQLSKYDFLFVINAKGSKEQLFISCSPSYSRIHLTEMNYEKPDYPPTFCMFLRKHLEGGIIEDIVQVSNDRIIIISVTKRNELGDLATKKLIIEVMGRHSNIIITEEDNRILEAVKHVMPFEDSERTIFPSAIYHIPISEKINPYDVEKRNIFLSNPEHLNEQVLLDNFIGFSPLITSEIMFQFHNSNKSIKVIFDELLNTNHPQIIHGKKDYFYYTDLSHLNGNIDYYDSVNILLDRYYFERDSIDIIKQKSKDLVKFIKNHINKAKTKYEKLQKELMNTSSRDEFRVKGELIQANMHHITKGETKLTCNNYYTNEDIIIELDPKLTPIENSEKYFKKYKKLKISIPYIEEQIQDSLLEKKYFEELLHQIENATLKDIEEIKEELEDKNYLKRKNVVNKKKKRPNYETFVDKDGVEILVGKNNIQNEYISHKLAKHNEVWFHVKEAPGSHVIVRKSFPLSETTIRTAAQLASYFSKLRLSNSVPVDYLEVRYLKKVPGRINSFVTYKNNKTIYIDPDESFILDLRKK